ncbi:hypothetical protein TNCV_2500031 [Trichonephila clavipes]|nr:hypothetical protein TNCV_2500031 [Trichonephila clavipes]
MQGARASFKHGRPARARSSYFPVSSKRLTNFKIPADFKKCQTVGARLAGANIAKPCLLLSVSGSTVSKLSQPYTQSVKISSEKENSGWKEKVKETDEYSSGL